jgi:phage terminase large subunit
MFSNAKSQAWWSVADRLRETYNAVVRGKEYDPANIISISCDLPKLQKLLDELSTPYKDLDNSGKAKVESKKDLAKRDVKSPNLADAFIMAFAPQEWRGSNWANAV